MAEISKPRLAKTGLFRWTKMTITGRITWELPKEGELAGGMLVFHFFGDDPGPDPSRQTIGVWVSRGPRSRAETKEYAFRADTRGGTDTKFSMKVRNFQIGDSERRFNEDRGRDEIYVKVRLENPSGEPKVLAQEVHSNTVTGWF